MIELLDITEENETQDQRNMRAARNDTPKRIVEWKLSDYRQAIQVNREIQALSNWVAYGKEIAYDIKELKTVAG